MGWTNWASTPSKISNTYSHHLIEAWHSSLSRWRLRLGDGSTDSQEAARVEKQAIIGPYLELRKHDIVTETAIY